MSALSYKGYWAAETNAKRLVQRTLDRFAWYQASLRNSGRLSLMLRSMAGYYGLGLDGQRDANSLLSSGEQGEVTELHVNGLKPVVQNVVSIVAGTRPATKPVVTNSDAKNAAEGRLAMSLHEYYERETLSQDLEVECVRGGVICGQFSIIQSWAPSKGEEVALDIEDGQLTYEGDVELFLSPPWRTAFENSSSEGERRWTVFRRRRPLHDLIARAKSPELKAKLEKCIAMPAAATLLARSLPQAQLKLSTLFDELMGEVLNPEDDVWVWEMRHLPCPALPLGRLLVFVEPDLVLFDSLCGGEPPQQNYDLTAAGGVAPVKYIYEELHAYEYSPERVVGTAIGHTSTFDLGGLQEALDICTTSIATTVNFNGMPHIWAGGGAPNRTQIDGGPAVLESPVKPEVVDFPALKPEVVQAADWVVSKMNAAAALNDTVMGNPEKGMPASAQALQRAQAVQYHQVSQNAWVRLVQRNATGRLKLLKRFARTERVATIAGAGAGWELKNWKAADIAGVSGFQMEPINPMSATFEGRTAIVEMLGITGDALLDFVTTGSLKKVTEQRTLQLELVEKNKALLLRGIGLAPVDMAQSMAAGQPVFVAPPPGPEGKPAEYVTIAKTDPHHLAIPAYMSVVNSPETRADTKLATAALDCVNESMRLWTSLTPDECAAFGIPPLPSHMQPAMPPQPGPASETTDEQPGAVPTPEGQPEAASDFPAPPPDPITGESQDSADLSLGA